MLLLHDNSINSIYLPQGNNVYQAEIPCSIRYQSMKKNWQKSIHILKQALKSFLFFGLIYMVLNLLSQKTSYEYKLNWLIINGNQLELSFKADNSAIIMLLVVAIIGYTVLKYASRYLISDITRNRFLIQTSLTICCVVFFILSSNLLTAFIGWQLIGLNLYLLLNHYHYQPAANRAAKKKYIINKLGDISFLMAIVLCYYYYGTTDYITLGQLDSIKILFGNTYLSIHSLIVGLVFIAIMTKSAQFPFHIWLPDTMHTPTPVSALMHAGVINAGGILLARLSPLFTQTTLIPYFICSIGIITLITGSLFKTTQVDIKKQLAYSTMSQMGYMVMQSGLGLFSAALFHLIAHGFYKAFLFMNAGNTLFENKKHDQDFINHKFNNFIIACFFAMGMVTLTCLLIKHFQMPILVLSFISITIHQMVYTTLTQNISLLHKIILIFLYQLLLIGYAHLLASFEMVSGLENHLMISETFQKLVSILIIGGYVSTIFIKKDHNQISTLGKKAYLSIKNKFYIEELFRKLLLNPLRSIGDKLNKIAFLNFPAFVILALSIPVYAFIQSFYFNADPSIALNITLAFMLIFLLVMANRGKSLTSIFSFLILSHLSLITLGYINLDHHNFKPYYGFLAQYASIFFGLWLLTREHSSETSTIKNSNQLTSWGVYMMILVFLLIGFPGTVSFVCWFTLFQTMLNNSLLIPFLMLSNLTLAICLLHLLQDYVFNLDNSASIQKNKLTKHLILVAIIGFNIINGIA